MFDAKSFWMGFAAGLFSLGFIVMMNSEPMPKPKEITYSELERRIDKMQCDSEKIELLWSERIRLTGQPNP